MSPKEATGACVFTVHVHVTMHMCDLWAPIDSSNALSPDYASATACMSRPRPASSSKQL